MRTIIVIATAVSVGGCTQMKDYFPDSKIVSVDSIDFAVSPALNKPDTYKLMPNNPRDMSMIVIDPMTWVRNVKAIELATGCSVYRESVKNTDATTFASVDCQTQTARR